jgi:hypothetical protein
MIRGASAIRKNIVSPTVKALHHQIVFLKASVVITSFVKRHILPIRQGSEHLGRRTILNCAIPFFSACAHRQKVIQITSPLN